jgi:hypothetical protein
MVLLSLLVACSGEEAAPETKAPAADACGLSFDTLDGTAWVYLQPGNGGPDKPNPMGRMKFAGAGTNLTAKYTAGAEADVYDYACTVAGGLATCLETSSHADAFCKAWAATHDGVCDPAAVAAATGIPQDEVAKAAETVNAMLKKLSKAEAETQRTADNSPNNKIRGKFMVAVDKGTCDLVVQDHYLTMVDGQVRELSNPIEGHFIKAKEDYTFTACKDPSAAWAGDGEEHVVDQGAGAPVKFRGALSKEQKADAACTYSATVYKDWVKLADVPGKADPKRGIVFETAMPFTEPGIHGVYFDRVKTCGGTTENLGVACAFVRVQ